MTIGSIRHWLFVLCAASALPVHRAEAAEIEIFADDSFEAAVESLNPGDVLTVHQGTYIDSGRISIEVKGTASSPVVIKAAEGESRPLISRSPGDTAQNTINIEGAEYLTIRGLEISSNGGDGINMSSGPSYITLEDLTIHDVSVGINFRSSMHHIVVRQNHIYSTNDTGEGLYVGCNYATCAVSDSLIENNWIHDTLAAEQGDGIEIKRGSHSNIIRNNVIHDTNWPCVLLYGTEGNPRNIVEGNVMWNCGEAGIQVAADTIIRNNVILNSPDGGLISQSHQGVSPANLEFVHNTIVTDGLCVSLRGWDDKEGMVFANNAVYCESGRSNVGGLGGVTVTGNVFEPALGGFPSGGYAVGRSEGLDFVDASAKIVYPSSDSAMIGAGNSSYATAQDFNGTPRTAGVDAGAYAWTGAQNPGWTIAPGFKDSAPGPSLALAASPSTVGYQEQSTLTWTSENSARCDASGDWTGPRAVSGQEDVGPLEITSTYEIVCSSSSGDSVSRSVTVTVADTPALPPDLNLTADTNSVPAGGAATLSWQATDADSCTASGSWSGSRTTEGTESSGPLASDALFVLKCRGSGGTVERSVAIAVQSFGSDDPMASTGDGSGAGAVSWLLLLGMLSTAALRGSVLSERSSA